MSRPHGSAWLVLVLAALVGAVVGLSVVTAGEARATSYLSNDPKACVNCHVMREQYDGWQKTTHHAVAGCNDCHVPHDLIGKYTTKAVHGYRHSKAFTLQDFHEPIQIRPEDLAIVNENCARCHAGLVGEITAHAAARGAVGGAGGGAGNEPVECTHCHAGIGHGARR